MFILSFLGTFFATLLTVVGTTFAALAIVALVLTFVVLPLLVAIGYTQCDEGSKAMVRNPVIASQCSYEAAKAADEHDKALAEDEVVDPASRRAFIATKLDVWMSTQKPSRPEDGALIINQTLDNLDSMESLVRTAEPTPAV